MAKQLTIRGVPDEVARRLSTDSHKSAPSLVAGALQPVTARS